MFNQYQSALPHSRSMTALLLACLWLFAATCHAADPAWQGVWSGTLGKSAVTACLQLDGPSFYRYQRYQKDIPLTRKDRQWQEATDGTITGIWTLGNPQGDTLEGTWQNPETGHSLPIHLGRVAVTGNEAACESQQYQTQVQSTKDSSTISDISTGINTNVDVKSPKFVKVAGGLFSSVVESRDGKALVAVGEDGTIVRSTDGGKSWTDIASGILSNLNQVVAVDKGVLLAVGERGSIVRSVDDGVHWAIEKSGTSNNLIKLAVLAGVNVVGVGDGGTIVRSPDGGVHWSATSLGEDIHFIDVATNRNGVLVVVGYCDDSIEDNEYTTGIMMRSFNGGADWTKVVDNEETPVFSYNSVIAVSDNVFVAVGSGDRSGVISRSTDEGVNWHEMKNGASYNLNSVAVVSDKVLISVGGGSTWLTPRGVQQVEYGGATIMRSIDGGASWGAVKNSGTDEQLDSTMVTPDGMLIIFGYGGNIFRSVDSGKSWLAMNSGVKASLSSVVAVNGGGLVAVGDGGVIVRSQDSGNHWSIIKNGLESMLKSLVISRQGVLVVVGTDGTIERSVDGGSSWSVITSGVHEDLWQVVEQGGALVAVGNHGLIMRSIDDGANWSHEMSITESDLYSVAAGIGNSIVAVGEGGIIVRSSDGGAWHQVKSGVAGRLLAVRFNASVGFVAVGSNGEIVHSLDGGRYWVASRNRIHGEITSVAILSDKNLVVAGIGNNGGGILDSCNLNTDSFVARKDTKYGLYSISAGNSGHVVAVGDQGAIFRSKIGDTSWSMMKCNTNMPLFDVIEAQDGTIVAVGHRVIVYSSDGGRNWHVLQIGSDLFRIISEPDGTLVAVGDNGVIIRGGPFPRK